MSSIFDGQFRKETPKRSRDPYSSKPNRYGSRSSKYMQMDLVTSLGFVKEKIPPPSSCSLNKFALELFFEFQRGDSLNILLTADHLEHGFMEIAEAANSDEKLSGLSSILDICFVFVFTDILVSDGKTRAHSFLDRQKHIVSQEMQENLVPRLYTVIPDHIDAVPEVLEYNNRSAPSNFPPDFYIALDDFASSCKSNGAVFLLRHYFHNMRPVPCDLKVTRNGFNHVLEEVVHDDKQRPFFDEYKSTSIAYEQQLQNGKRHTSSRHFTPSITSLTAPSFATMCCGDSQTNTLFYSKGRELFMYNPPGDCMRVFIADDEITAMDVSEGGKYVVIGDVTGIIYFISLSESFVIRFVSCKSMITSLSLTPKLPSQFAAGTLNGAVYVFTTQQKNPLRMFLLHSEGITNVVMHASGEYVASASVDGTVRFWSLTLNACVRLFDFPRKKPISLKFSKSGNLLLVTCFKGFIGILEIGSGKMIRSANIEAKLADADFSYNDACVSVVDITGGFSMWNLSTTSTVGELHVSAVIDTIHPFQVKCVGMNELRVIGIGRK